MVAVAVGIAGSFALSRATWPTSSPAWRSPSHWCRCWLWSGITLGSASSHARAPAFFYLRQAQRGGYPIAGASPFKARRDAWRYNWRQRARLAPCIVIIALVVVLRLALVASSSQTAS